MGRTRTIGVRDLTLGLHDFPERAKLGHAAEALNVEHRYGGVSTRRGCLGRANIETTESDFKGLWFYRRENGDSYFLCAWVINDPLDANYREGRLAVLNTSGQLVQELDFLGSLSEEVRFSDDGGARWGGTSWMDTGSDHVVFLIGVSNRPVSLIGVTQSSLWQVAPVGGGLGPLRLSNQTVRQRHDGTVAVDPFWGGVNPDVRDGDDIAPYLVGVAQGVATGGPSLAIHNDRLVTTVRDVDTDWGNRFAVRLSNTGDSRGWPRPGYLTFGAESALDLTGLASWEGRLCVFNRSNMWTVNYEGINQYDIHWTMRGSGCIAKDTIANIPKANRNWLVWLSQDGLYGWAGGPEPTYLSDRIEKQLRILSSDTWAHAHGFYYPRGNQYFLAVPDTDPRVTALYVWDVLYDAWSRWNFAADGTAFPYILGFAYDTSGRTPPACVMRIGTTLRFVSLYTNGHTDNYTGTNRTVTSRWVSHPIGFGRNQVDRVRYIRPTMTMQGDVANRRVFWLGDNESYQLAVTTNGQSGTVPGSPELPGGAPATFGNILFGNERMGVVRDFTERVDAFGSPTRTAQVGIETTASDAPFQLLSFEVDVVERGVRR